MRRRWPTRASDGARLGTEHAVTAWARQHLDLTRHHDVHAKILELAPEVIINCSGYNNVDQAEQDQETAFNVNAFIVRTLARTAAELDAVFIHYSSDFVFSGHVDHAVHRERSARAPERVRAIEARRRVDGRRCAESLRPSCREPVWRSDAAQQHRSHRRRAAIRYRCAGVCRSGGIAQLCHRRRRRFGILAADAARRRRLPLRQQRSRDLVRGRSRDRTGVRQDGRPAQAGARARRGVAGAPPGLCRARQRQAGAHRIRHAAVAGCDRAISVHPFRHDLRPTASTRQARIAVASLSFAGNASLREELTAKYPHVTFTDSSNRSRRRRSGGAAARPRPRHRRARAR